MDRILIHIVFEWITCVGVWHWYNTDTCDVITEYIQPLLFTQIINEIISITTMKALLRSLNENKLHNQNKTLSISPFPSIWSTKYIEIQELLRMIVKILFINDYS
jgi:hypothetical protein